MPMGKLPFELYSFSINPIAMKIADKIAGNCGHACVLMVRNDKLTKLSSECLSLFLQRDEKWRECNQ